MSELVATEVGEGVLAVASPISNAGVVDLGDAVLVIDQLAKREWGTKLREMAARARPGAPVYVLQTHYHWDHLGGGPAFASDAVIGSASSRDLLLAEGGRYLQEGLKDFTRLGDYLPSLLTEGPLAIQGTKRVAVVRFLGRSAHTPVDLVVDLPDDDVVFTGDLLFNGLFPVVDARGSVAGWANSLAELVTFGRQTFVGGHGPVAGKAEISALAGYFGEVLAAAARASRNPDEAAMLRDEPRIGHQAWGRAERHDGTFAKALAEIGS